MIEQPFPPKLCRDREELAHSYLERNGFTSGQLREVSAASYLASREQKPAIITGALSVALIFLFGLASAALLAWLMSAW